jgi:transposase
MEVVHPRCAGIDVSKKDAKVCVRIQGGRGRKTTSTVTTWGAMTNQVLALKDHLAEQGVTVAVMESTSDYWRPFYYVLEADLEVLLVNARDVKNVPGRKTDVSDAAWLADPADLHHRGSTVAADEHVTNQGGHQLVVT